MTADSERTMIGLIGPHHPGGTSTVGGIADWNLVIHFAAWKWPGSPTKRGELRAEMAVSEERLRRYMSTLEPYQIIQARLLKPIEKGIATIEEITRIDVSDSELGTISSELQAPIEFSDPMFGVLAYERACGWYKGESLWCGRPVEITLSCSDPSKPEGVLCTARKLFNDQTAWAQRVSEYAVEKLLDLKNGNWLDEGEEELTSGDFIGRMTLQSIAVEETGEFAVWHDDGGLFWGHAIAICGDLVNGLTDAGIHD